MKITFLTGNEMKYKIASYALKDTGIELLHQDLETPEVQTMNVEEVAGYSAEWAANKLQTPVVLTDAGFYINALNGFPGPFVKFVNKWFTTEDFLKLLEDKEDRSLVVKDCLAYCKPGEKAVTFIGEAMCTLAESYTVKGTTAINTLLIPDGFDKTEPELGPEVMAKFWADNFKNWDKFVEYLKSKN